MENAKENPRLSKLQNVWFTSLALAIITFTSWTSCLAQATLTQNSDERAETPKTGSITGRVVNESGQPLANAVVYVRAFGSTGQGNVRATDGQGNFHVGALDPVAYQVWATVPAYTAPLRDPDSNQAPYYRIGDSVRLELIRGGVITGIVTTSSGEPVVAVRVLAYMLRDGNGQPPRYGGAIREQPTDDRGIYRIYGLAPGTYIVSAGGSETLGISKAAEYESHAPTYAPSSTRDTPEKLACTPVKRPLA